MKKFAVSLLAILLVLTMATPVFAAGNFVSSPSATDYPRMVNYSFKGDCEGELIVTPYSQRHNEEYQMTEDGIVVLEGAYKECHDCKDLTQLMPVEVPKGKTGLAIGDLFNVHFVGCKEHHEHNPFTVTIRPSTLKNFVGLVALVDGEWVYIDSIVDGDTLTFTSSYYGPYAIILSTDGSPVTGDDFPWGYVIAMVVSAAGLVAIAFTFKKKVV